MTQHNSSPSTSSSLSAETVPSGYWLLAIALGVASLMFGLLYGPKWSAASQYVMDDAFITFRYAQNLLDSGSMRWNMGRQLGLEDAHEGYTSLLWVWLVAAFKLLGLSPIAASKAFAALALVASSVAVGWGVSRWVKRTAPQTANAMPWLPSLVAAAGAPLLLLPNPDWTLHLQSGMETALALLMWTALGLQIAALASGSKPVGLGTGLALAATAWLAALNRPEMGMVFLVMLGGLAWVRRDQWRALAAHVLVPFALLSLAYMLWRWAKYGLLMPLPFYVKTSQQTLAGLPDVSSYLWTLGALWPGCVAAVAWPATRRLALPLFAGLLAFLVFYLFPAHLMGAAHRLLIPSSAVAVLLNVWLLAVWVERNNAAWAKLATPALMLGMAAWLPLAGDKNPLGGMQWYATGLNRAHIALGQTLGYVGIEQNTQPTLAMGDAGAVPYFSAWRVIDTFGLNNRQVALMRHAGSYDAAQVLREPIDLLVLISKTCANFEPHDAIAYERDLRKVALGKGYQDLGRVEFQGGYFLWLLAPQGGITPKLVDALNKAKLLKTCG